MLPTHRLSMPNEKAVYDDDNKYDKLNNKPVRGIKGLAAFLKPRQLILLIASIVAIWIVYHHSNPPATDDLVADTTTTSSSSSTIDTDTSNNNDDLLNGYIPPIPDRPSTNEDKIDWHRPESDTTKGSSTPPSSTGPYLFTQHPPLASLHHVDDADAAYKQQRIVDAFRHAWKGYATDAFGKDEYQPLRHQGRDWAPGGIGLMIVDALDTMLLMNLTDEYQQAREWVATRLDFDKKQDVNVFETTIRVLGGLLSAYHLSGNDPVYLEKATDLGQRLIGAFQTNSGIPYSSIVLSTGLPFTAHVPSSTAEVTTIQLEFKYLSHLTGDYKYWEAAERVMYKMKDLVDAGEPTIDGLVPILIHPISGKFTTSEIRLGSRGDSYYEYLLKQYLQTQKSETLYMDMYRQSVRGIRQHLLARSQPNNLLFIGELHNLNSLGQISPKMDHLVCFIGGSFALGATQGLRLAQEPLMTHVDEQDLELGREITRTCYEMYNTTATGLASEIVYFNTQEDSQQDISIHPGDRHNLLRPETMESIFLMYRITGDPIYREWGWKIFEAFEKYTKLPGGGYTALRDVTSIPPTQDDRMDTFFLAETLKYLYLLFSPDDMIPLDHYVFNSEAHPLPVFSPNKP
ncbi:hypothetical protein O0I10_005548 [Lichtheimia ornata]|uniref:alpha-1,2-Mannosidase n=1 Tax=Lichtheimia ornata TaxID=688661 RepID=A0AAD7XZL8_9FUNG|nr:uncharacterized protein O0I10_005548 [Lichtheimia ornata]KAJ8658821.1 hypothetical protein O0I10_005548 [Lichtheimia ornata]